MKRGTAEEQIARKRQIWRERAKGYTWATIAERNGLSARRAQQIVKEYREEDPFDAATRTEAVVEALELFDRVIEEYTELIETTRHPAVKLGAMNARLRAVERRTAIEQSLGLLPNNLALIEQHEFALWLTDALSEAIHRLKIAAPAHVLEPLDDALLKLEVDAKTWRRNQHYPRLEGEVAVRQARREVTEEKPKFQSGPAKMPKTQADRASYGANT